MEPFEYVIVLSSLILGLCIAQILNGAADLLADVRKTKFSLTHSIFIAVVFMVTIQDWFYTYQYSKQVESWTLAVVMAILVFPLVLFILARFIYPTGARSQERDMTVYFSDNWRWLYGYVDGALDAVRQFLEQTVAATDPDPVAARTGAQAHA